MRRSGNRDESFRDFVSYVRGLQLRIGADARILLDGRRMGRDSDTVLGLPFCHELAQTCLRLDLLPMEEAVDGARQGFHEFQSLLESAPVMAKASRFEENSCGVGGVHYLLLSVERKLVADGAGGRLPGILNFVGEFETHQAVVGEIVSGYCRMVVPLRVAQRELELIIERTFQRACPQRKWGRRVDHPYAVRVVRETLCHLNDLRVSGVAEADPRSRFWIAMDGICWIRDRALSLAEGFDIGHRLAG